MIVSEAFPDDCMEIAWQQHDVYGDALSILAKECQRKTLIAAGILGAKPPIAATRECQFDHRTLQMAHDVIAAAWRFRMNAPQIGLPFETRATLGMQNWLEWLRQEVLLWENEPNLIRKVMQILTNQNTKVGYLAEARLTLALLNRYRDVPWGGPMADLRRRLEHEADHDLEA